MLKSRRQFPPGGFHFFESRTNWSPPPMLDFETTVDFIIQHRKANPRFKDQWSVKRDDVAKELDEQTCKHLSTKGLFDQWCSTGNPASFQSGTATKPSEWLSRKLESVAAVRKVVAGIGVLTDWLGSGGKPVEHSLASHRASICASCPQNQEGDWTRFFTKPAADTIRKQLAIKHDMELKTDNDKRLGVCGACLCQLNLKVHTPLNHVLDHTSDEVRQRLDPRCWIFHEPKSA